MTQNKLTQKDCYNEMVRLLKIYFYQKSTDQEKDFILKSVKTTLEQLNQIEHNKMLLQEARRAEKEARKYGAR